MRHRPRLDANHREIVRALRQCGYRVLSLAALGGGCPDLLVYRRGKLELVEIKATTGKPTPDQVRFQAAGWPVVTVRRVEDVLAYAHAG